MGKKAGNRKHSKIDALDPALRETVEQMLLSGSTYSEIVDFLGANGVGISVASVCRYARAYQAEVQMLNMAQENFRRMMDELDKYPDLDTTEAIIRLTSQNLLNALANTSEEDWQGVSIDKMLREANALVRAATRSAWRSKTGTPPRRAWMPSSPWCGRRWPRSGLTFTARSMSS